MNKVPKEVKTQIAGAKFKIKNINQLSTLVSSALNSTKNFAQNINALDTNTFNTTTVLLSAWYSMYSLSVFIETG